MSFKRKTNNKGTENKSIDPKLLNRIFILIIVVFTFALYGNTIKNRYNLDDYHIAKENPNFKRGFAAVPTIFTTLYASENGLNYGYRPLVRASFAIEHGLFTTFNIPLRWHPHASHFINLLLYLAAVLLLFKMLRVMIRNYHPLFAFVVTMLFIAHPVHTEVVASLKNRDDLMVLITSFSSLLLFLKYADTHKKKFAVWGILIYFLGFLAKPTAASFFFVIPLSLYFFTGMSPKKIITLSLILAGASFLATFGPFLFLESATRPLRMEETPLPFDDTLAHRLAYGGYTLYYYMRLLIVPHPLLFYYGYNVFPIVSLLNYKVVLSILFHLGIFIYAIYKFREKSILSYAILFYLVTIAIYTNVVRAIPGIIGERFLLIASLGFCIALAYFLFRLLKADPERADLKTKKLSAVLAVMLLILIPYSAKTITRNKAWYNQYTLYKSDIRYLYNSVKANDLYANEIMKAVNREMGKPVNVLKFVDPMIQEASHHWRRAVEILPSHHTSWNNLGIIQSRIYKNYDSALSYFDTALRLRPDWPQTYFNIGQAYEGMQSYDTALLYYQQNLQLDPQTINTRSRIANIYYGQGRFKEAVDMNYEIMRVKPDEPLPYINLGNYYIFQGDTTGAIRFYEEAVELGAPARASDFFSRFYADKGDIEKSNHYRKVSDEQKRKGRNY